MVWDDFRYFSALAKTGTVRGAARYLAVNPSTVTRRLESLEGELGVVLFLRSPSGLQITAEGQQLQLEIDRVADDLYDIQLRLKGRDQRLTGSIRVVIPEVLARAFLLAELKQFSTAYPEIDLVILSGYEPIVMDGHIDVVLCFTDSPADNLVGRELGPVALAAYGHPDGLSMSDHGVAPSSDWVGWANGGELMNVCDSLREQYFPDVCVKVRGDQVALQLASVKAGLGCGILPCFVAEPDTDLVRLSEMPVQTTPPLWLLMHPQLRTSKRVAVFVECLREAFTQRRTQLYEGWL